MSDRMRPVRPPRDPLAEVPAFDPALPPDQNPPPPPGTAETQAAPLQDIESCKAKLRELAQEVLTASPSRAKALPLDVQRVRVAMLLLTEAESGASDPDTYKELSMLNRMLAGEDDLDEPTGDEVRHAEAEELLAARGIHPDVARRLMRVFESLGGAQETGDGEPARRRRASH